MSHIKTAAGTFHVETRGLPSDTAAPVLLLVHGFPLDHSMWSKQLDAISTPIVAADLRGFGRTTAEVPAAISMERFADDLASILDALEISQPVNYCGLSMGGYIAWEFWQRHRARLQKLILCDTRAAADTAEVAKARELMALEVMTAGNEPLVAGMEPKLFSPHIAASDPQLVAAMRKLMLQTPAPTVAAALRGMAQRADFTARLGKVDVPTLAVCGVDDVITPVGEMQAMADAMPDAQFLEIQNAGHLAPLENPIDTNRAIEAFLSQG